MARILKCLQTELSAYVDRRFPGNADAFAEALRTSTTIYVGNLSFYTTEEQIHELFSKCGEVRRIIMGLDKQKMTPCGFCFVLYYTRAATEDCVKFLSGTILDERPIRCDFDWGFLDGRQFGRGRTGGQVRDEYRTNYDEGRGGFGHMLQEDLETAANFAGGQIAIIPANCPLPIMPRGPRPAPAGEPAGEKGTEDRDGRTGKRARGGGDGDDESAKRSRESNPRFRRGRDAEARDDDDDGRDRRRQ